MNIVLVAIVLAFVCLLVIWLVPSWPALSVQLASLFPRVSADTVLTPVQLPKKLRAGKQPPVHATARLHGGKRHTVLPHQARGR